MRAFLRKKLSKNLLPDEKRTLSRFSYAMGIQNDNEECKIEDIEDLPPFMNKIMEEQISRENKTIAFLQREMLNAPRLVDQKLRP